MTRPQIDLRKYIIGGVDDYANREDLDRDTAWEQIILRGLEAERVKGFYDEDDGAEE
jgi:hypothetical protein